MNEIKICKAINEALFHLSIKTISRADGRSAIVAIAYRAACLMRGQNGDIVADYRRRTGVLHSQIITPSGAPIWAKDRQLLWLNASAKESRKNSVEAREFEAAIPAGLSHEEAIALVKEFSTELVAKHSFVIDFSLHADNRSDWTGSKKNFNGYHAHITATTRRIDGSGFTEKTRELDEKNSGMVYFWRRRWADLSNEYLARAGINSRIDHRSHKDRGIERVPTKHLGPQITAMERRGIRTKQGEYTRNLLKAFVLGVVERNTASLGSIDQISTVSQALSARDKVKNAHHSLTALTKKLLVDLEFEQTINSLSNKLKLVENSAGNFSPEVKPKIILRPQ